MKALIWLAMASLLAFIAIAVTHDQSLFDSFCGTLKVEQLHNLIPLFLLTTSFTSLLTSWYLMVAAMMLPVLAKPVTQLWQVNFKRHRMSSIAIFLMSYSTVWVFSAMIIYILAIILKVIIPSPYVIFLLLLLAIVWSSSPLAQFARNKAHRLRSVRPFAPSCMIDSVLYGLKSGFWCVLSCWIWMIIPLVIVKGHLTSMVIVTIIIYFESLLPSRPLIWRVPPAVELIGLLINWTIKKKSILSKASH